MNTPVILPARGKFHGVLQILLFNWRFYAAAVIVLLATAAALKLLTVSLPLQAAFEACLALAAVWLSMSLVVSHWVYDRSEICQWRWLRSCLPILPKHWANIHAGLDESSGTLRQLFPDAEGEVFDIFDPIEMTEASIAEARASAQKQARAVPANFRALPLPDAKLDAIFLMFAAHEIRQVESRLRFFQELCRVLDATGRIVLLEHLRDWRNFLAYGPGCLHFHTRRTWLLAATKGGLIIEKEFRMTPFVKVFVFRKNL